MFVAAGLLSLVRTTLDIVDFEWCKNKIFYEMGVYCGQLFIWFTHKFTGCLNSQFCNVKCITKTSQQSFKHTFLSVFNIFLELQLQKHNVDIT